VSRFLLRRLLVGLLTIWFTSVVVFLLVHNIPGDPIAVLLQQNNTPEIRTALERFYGLDQPLHVQYGRWLRAIADGNLGVSLVDGSDVASRLLERLPRSIYLMVGATVLSLLISLAAGSVAALRKGGAADVLVTGGALALQSTPSFWIGILLLRLFGVQLGWLPTSGYVAPSESLTEFMRHAILPMLAAGGALAGITTRTVRASLVGELRQDYVLLATAGGAPFGRRIVPVHVMRNALTPITTLVGLQIGILLSGTVIIETVFAYPGLGMLLINAVQQRDYPMIQGTILLLTIAFVTVNLLVDVAVTMLDPKGRRRQDG
jgi:peptide/nickel transport system permease protein